LAGTFGDAGNFVVGVYYFSQDLDIQKQTNGGPMLGPYIDIVEPDVPAAVAGMNLVSLATMGLIPPAGVAFPANSASQDYITQEHESIAVFGQVDIPMGDAWTLTLGARYTDEDKTMVGIFEQEAQGPPPDLDALRFALCQASPLCGPAMGLPPFNPFDPDTQSIFAPFAVDGWGTYLFDPLAPRSNLNETLKDDQVTGTAKLSWRPNDDTMLYASYGTGYKSGGTNTDRINAAFNPVFGPEDSETIEIGIKADFPDKNMRLNIAIYDTQVEDLQANSFTGTGFNLQNAGAADTSGAEIEFWWYPSDTLTVQTFYSRSNADYKSFVNGTCWDAYVFHTGMPDPGGTGDINDEVCDRTGGRIAYNPEDRFYFGLTKDFPLSGSKTAFVRAEYSYASDLLTDGDLDPFTLQDSLNIVNLRLGLRWGDEAGSELVAWGRNLGDERYYAGSFDAPVQPGRMNSYPSEPRTYGLTYRKSF
jgi:iron complex outermembrane receptor protein